MQTHVQWFFLRRCIWWLVPEECHPLYVPVLVVLGQCIAIASVRNLEMSRLFRDAGQEVGRSTGRPQARSLQPSTYCAAVIIKEPFLRGFLDPPVGAEHPPCVEERGRGSSRGLGNCQCWFSHITLFANKTGTTISLVHEVPPKSVQSPRLKYSVMSLRYF